MRPTIAIVERLPGHSEDMGGFAALGQELGYDTHLYSERNDRFHLIDYFRSRFSFPPDHIHDWAEITDPGIAFDVILLNTSFVWLDYMPQLMQWNTSKRLIVVHHHPEDAELSPFGTALYLTPAAGMEKWIFPLYSKPQIPQELPGKGGPPLSRTPAELPTLTCIGTFEGKDITGARDYMDAGGRLVHYDRHRCHDFPDREGLYTQHQGLEGLPFMAALCGQSPPIFLWLPIVFPSDYMVCRFTAALITGVDMNCVMVMPERLRALYGFPEAAVIAYGESITEPVCLEKLRDPLPAQYQRRRQLQTWAADRWEKNLQVFRAALGLGKE